MGDIGRTAQAAASVADSGIAAGATISAANTEASAAKYASDNSLKAATQANQLQTTEFNTAQNNEKPWLQAGTTALSNIQNGLGSQYNADYSGNFNAPTSSSATPTYSGANETDHANTQFSFDGSDLANTPGYQFELQQGLNAVNANNNATGITGGAAAKAIADYTTGLATQNYNTAYSQAQNTFQQNYSDQANQNQQNFSNQYNVANSDFSNTQAQQQQDFNDQLSEYNTQYNQFENDQNTNYNREASLANIGQTATSSLNAAGSNYASSVGSNLTNAASASGNYLTQGASATAAGYTGLSNAIQSGINGVNNAYQTAQQSNSLGNINNYYGSNSDEDEDDSDDFS